MRKKIIVFVLAAISLFCLCGCSKKGPHDTRDVINYLDSLRCPDVVVSDECEAFPNAQGDECHSWKAKSGDIEFTVADICRYTDEGKTYELVNDFDSAVAEQVYKELSESDVEMEKSEAFGNRIEVVIIGEYTDLEGLERAVNSLNAFSDEYNNVWTYGRILYDLKFMNPLRNNCPDDEVTDGDYDGCLLAGEHVEMQKVVNRYIQTCLDYRFEDNLAQMTNEEIVAALNDASEEVRLLNPDGVPYNNLCAGRHYPGLSFGTLYRLLEQHGYEVTGTPEHFTFSHNKDYEFSYSFIDDDDWYYYLVDGEPVNTQILWGCHLTLEEVYEITGLQLSICNGASLPPESK